MGEGRLCGEHDVHGYMHSFFGPTHFFVALLGYNLHMTLCTFRTHCVMISSHMHCDMLTAIRLINTALILHNSNLLLLFLW